jgi:hypothetical protein
MRYQVNVELVEVGDGGKLRLMESHLIVDLTDKAKGLQVYQGTVRLIEVWIAAASARLFG